MSSYRKAEDFPVIELPEAANDNVWLVAMVEPRSEFRVFDGLKGLGVTAYLPCETRWRPTPDGKGERVRRPLIPGYLFVGFSVDRHGGFRGLHEAHGVRGLSAFIKRDGRASEVHHGELATISAKEAAGRFDYTRDKKAAKSEVRAVTLSLSDLILVGTDAVLDAVEKGDFGPLNAALGTTGCAVHEEFSQPLDEAA